MRSIPDSQAIALIAIMSLLTFFVRGLPFLLFSGKSKTPAYIMYLGKVLPYAARADRRHCHRSGTLLEEKYASLRWRRDTVLHVSCSDNF